MSSVFVCHCHDPVEQGASTAHGLTEWEIANTVCDEIKRELRLRNVRPIYLNQTLADRVRKINIMCSEDRLGYFVEYPTIAVEVHCNHSDDPGREGFFVMAHLCSDRGRRAAKHVLDSIATLRRGATNKGINVVTRQRQWVGTPNEYETDRQYFIAETVCPAILVEACFLSNEREARWISNPDNRERLGKAVGQGLAEYLKEESSC